MADMKPGTSSPQIAGLQKFLNTKFGYNVPTDGAYDEKTQQAVADLQGRMNMGYTSGIADAATMKAMVEAAKPRKLVEIDGKQAWVTQDQLRKLQELAGKRAAEAVQPYVSLVNEARMYWEAHEKARDNNVFWSRGIETLVGAKFPPRSLIDAAAKAADDMVRDARALKLDPKQLDSRTAPIKKAFKAISDYRSDLFDGGDTLIAALEVVKGGAVFVLTITAAVATGGASWQVQVGVSAGVAAYEQVLNEVDAASKTSNYSIATGLTNVFLSAVVDGTVGLILKGGGLGTFLDDVAEEAVKQAGSKALKSFAVKAVNGGAQQMIEDGIKGLPGLADPNKKFTLKDFVTAAVESFVKGAGLKILGPACEKFGKGASKHFKQADFKGLGKDIKLDKAGEEGIKKVIDVAGPKAVKSVLEKWSAQDDPNKFEDAVKKAILDEPAVRKALEAAMKGK